MDPKTEQAMARLPELIESPLGMSEILTVGTNLKPDAKNFLVDADIVTRTPMIFWFGETGVVFYCQSGATVGMDIVKKDFDLLQYFGEGALYLLGDDQDMGIVRYPIFPFLDGRNGGFETPPDPWVEKIMLIYREKADEFDGLAAIVIALDNRVQFGFTAIMETNFTYLFNNQCTQLHEEAQASPHHRVVEIKGKTPHQSGMTNSLLWLIE